jgi:hypothetical protein
MDEEKIAPKGAAGAGILIQAEPPRPITLSDARNFVPHLDLATLPPVELEPREWERLEQALDRRLETSLRAQLCDAMGYFLHSLRLKDELPAPRKYQIQLKKRLQYIEQAVNDLVLMIGKPSVSLPTQRWASIGLKEFERETGKIRLKKASVAQKRTDPASEILSLDDHIRTWLEVEFPSETETTMASLTDLLVKLHSMEKAVKLERGKQNLSGADGKFELDLLLREILQVAKVAGDDLKLPMHDIADEYMRVGVEVYPAYTFAVEVLDQLKRAAPKLIAEKVSDHGERQKILARIEAYLTRKTDGSLIYPLDEAKAFVLGHQ